MNSLGIRKFDFVEFYVGSAKMVAYWHAKAFGMDVMAYSGAETGHRDRGSYYLKKNQLKIVITSALQPETKEIHDFVALHGDGVKRIGYEVDDVVTAFEKIKAQGGIVVRAPKRHEDADGFVMDAAFRVYDDTEIVLVNYDNYRGAFRPGYGKPVQHFVATAADTGLVAIDHVVGNVRENEMDKWAGYFNKVFNFETFVDFKAGDIATQYSALLSKVVRSTDNVIKHPINEPYQGKRKSQIEEYIQEYRGSGVQHIAIRATDIISAIRAMRSNGVEFLSVPDTYYDALRARKLVIEQDMNKLQELGILLDFEGDGYLLQLFTKPIGDRPTFFYEIIQRVGRSEGFGKGNFQSLFEAIERDQERRGNL